MHNWLRGLDALGAPCLILRPCQPYLSNMPLSSIYMYVNSASSVRYSL